jgi:uncharacterized protein (DUF1810 family)
MVSAGTLLRAPRESPMNAINNDPMLERIDSAFALVRYALTIIQQAQTNMDTDLMGCTLEEAEKALTLAATDLKAVGATV